jgi:hypothetical protein
MTTTVTDKRVHTRSQFFLVQAGDELVTYFAFRPDDAINAIPVLVVDISDGGVQVLTSNTHSVDQPKCLLELVTGDDGSERARYAVHQVWSRPDGTNTRRGFAFEAGAAVAREVANLLADSEHRILRGVLYPA